MNLGQTGTNYQKICTKHAKTQTAVLFPSHNPFDRSTYELLSYGGLFAYIMYFKRINHIFS